jgi:hypothetical protein
MRTLRAYQLGVLTFLNVLSVQVDFKDDLKARATPIGGTE